MKEKIQQLIERYSEQKNQMDKRSLLYHTLEIVIGDLKMILQNVEEGK